MRRGPVLFGGVAALALLGAGVFALAPAAGQRSPQPLLPPGFGAPAPAAPAPEQPAAPSTPASPTPAAPAPAQLLPGVLNPPAAPADTDATDDDAADKPPVPEGVRRPIDSVGVLTDDATGFGYDAFGRANGRMLATLMTRLDAPIASRWGEILLRRALLTRVPTPAGLAAPDWIAERAWLLVRMGEADGARMLVDAVDVDQFDARLNEVAGQVALASADPAGLCPVSAAAGAAAPGEQMWTLAQGICAGLSGDSGTAAAFVDKARQKLGPRDIDVLLAEKVIGAGNAARRSVDIDWTPVSTLSTWRFGLASATGVAIPDRLFDTAGLQVRAWAARAPMLPVTARIANARAAAAAGVFSSAALVSMVAAAGEADDSADDSGTDPGRLRAAFAADSGGERVAAMRLLWDAAAPGLDRYAAAILTARAAARLSPGAGRGSDAEPLLASMLSAGYDRPAERWAGSVRDGHDGGWALLAVGAPDRVVPVDADRVESFAGGLGNDRAQRGRLLLAALLGLGRLDAVSAGRLSAQFDARLGTANSWTRAIDRAAAVGQPGTVALLAAIGLQAGSWDAVPAWHLLHIVAALRRTGHEAEARMIAAEAITRT